MAVPILKEPPITSRDAFIPYLMTGLNMLVPTIAAYPILKPHVFLVSVFLILLGVPCSVYFRQRGYNRIVLNLVTTLPLLILTWILVRSLPGLQLDWSNPLGSILSSESSLDQLDGMLHIFTVLAAGRAMLLVSSADLLQTPLPGISIFLLAVITHHDLLDRAPLTLLCLLVLFVSSAYLFSHEQHQQWFSIHTPPRIQRRLLRWTLIFALVLAPVVLAVGVLLQPFNMTNVTNRMRHRNPFPGNLIGRGGPVAIFLEPTIYMDGSRWPSGKQMMMTVTVNKDAPQNLLWRGATYAEYLNGSWEATDFKPRTSAGWKVMAVGGGRKQVNLLPGLTGDPGINQALKEKQSVTGLETIFQTFEFASMATRVDSNGVVPVFGAYQVMQVTGNEIALRRPAVASDGSIQLRNLTAISPGTIEVVSINKSLPTTWTLKGRLPYEDSKGSFAEHFEQYLQMPGGKDSLISRQIKQKAIEILGKRNVNLSTAKGFDIIHQIELEFNSNYRYTLKPSPPPHGVDPIVDFLYRQKQGYCNYFSGAMVMLCRSVGMPARFVVGFATGDVDESNTDPNTVRYQVNASHAHSWVEVYLKGYGWYTVDPTAGSRLAPTIWGTTWDVVTNIFETVKGWITSWGAAFRNSLSVRIISLSVLGLLLALAITLIVAFRDRPPEFPRHELTPEEIHNSVLACYKRMHRWLERWGVHKPQGCTASEFEQLFRQINPAMGEPVRILTDLYIRRQYGGATLDNADARQAIACMHELWAVAKKERKRLYATVEADT